MRNLLAVVSVVTLSSACAERSEDVFELVSMRDFQTNHAVLQGPGLTLQGPGLTLQGPGLTLQGPGLTLQGPGLTLQGPGLTLQGIEFQGPGLTLQGPGLTLQGPGLTLQGTSFTATMVKNGVVYHPSGLDFIGAEMDLRLSWKDGNVVKTQDVVLRINNIEQSVEQDDVLLYSLSYREKNNNQWLPYCGDNAVKAVPMKNYWDIETGDRIDNDKVVTFACTNAVIAKCALWGYRPWAKTTTCTGKGKKKKCSEISLQDHHQACTRMARADFCGDGHPHTVDGTAIDIYDQLNPQIQTRFTEWPTEAEWTPDGASCVSYVRHPELGLPSCFFNNKGKPIQKCKSKVDEDSLLVSAFSADGDDDDGDGQCSD